MSKLMLSENSNDSAEEQLRIYMNIKEENKKKDKSPKSTLS